VRLDLNDGMVRPDDTAFLRAIIANPDDDLPRLVYADYLDERGDPRGEFIRTQVELAQLAERPRRPRDKPQMRSPQSHDPALRARFRELRLRERELLKRHRTSWLRPFQGCAEVIQFWRGFVHWLATSQQAFWDRADEWFRAEAIQEVDFRDVDLAGFVELSLLLNLRAIRLPLNRAGMDGCFQYLAHCPFLRNVRALYLSQNSYLSNVGARALLASPHLTSLREIHPGTVWSGEPLVTPRNAAALKDRFGVTIHEWPTEPGATPVPPEPIELDESEPRPQPEGR
jgi:uncharacterized protein (TIGR02996 family)